MARSLLKDDATLSGILLFSGLRPVLAPLLQSDGSVESRSVAGQTERNETESSVVINTTYIEDGIREKDVNLRFEKING